MIYQKGGSNRNAHLKNQQSEKSHPFQKLVDVRKQLIDEAEALDEDIVPADKRSGAARRPEVQRRTESRLERRRDDAADESPRYQHQQFNESNMLLQKLMENLKGNPAL